MIANVTGGPPQSGCPWKAFTDPVCADVINACRWYESGQVAMILGSDPPAHILDGIELYQSAKNAVTSDRYDREAQKRKAERAKHGGK